MAASGATISRSPAAAAAAAAAVSNGGASDNESVEILEDGFEGFNSSEASSAVTGEKPTASMKAAIVLPVVCATLNSCSDGFDVGVSTSVGNLLQNSMDLSDVQLEFFMGSLNFVAIAGVLLASLVSDVFGRRVAFAVSSVCCILGSLLMAGASSYEFLMLGRMLVGLGVGCGMPLSPCYIAEISPPHKRGALVSCSEIATNVGILLGYVAGFLLHSLPVAVAWRYMVAIGALPPAVLLCLLPTVPESPRWLVQAGRKAEAAAVLSRLQDLPGGSEDLVREIEESIAREVKLNDSVNWSAILCPRKNFRRVLLIGIGVALCPQLAGINAVGYFLMKIIEQAGITSEHDQFTVLVALGFVKLCCILVAAGFFDSCGRRALMLLSCLGMVVANAFLSLHFLAAWTMPALAMAALGLYFCSFSVGMGPGSWLIPGELFPNALRAKAMSTSTFLNRLAATAFSTSVLSLANALTWGGFFVLLTGLNVGVMLFIGLLLPETRGKALEDMSMDGVSEGEEVSNEDSEEQSSR